MEINAIAKKWGDSIAVIIPKKIADAKMIKPNDEIKIYVEKNSGIKEAFGSLKNWKIDSQKAKEELRREWQKRDTS